MTHNSYPLRLIAIAVAFGAAPTIAAAQGSPQTPANQGGPMAIEQVQQRFTIAPEFKVSRFNNHCFSGASGSIALRIGPGLSATRAPQL